SSGGAPGQPGDAEPSDRVPGDTLPSSSSNDAMNTLIVLPSYNERSNIVELIQAILDADIGHQVCVVDDSSPDGTGQCIRGALAERSAWLGRVHLIERAKKDGRGGAVREGLAWGLAQA